MARFIVDCSFVMSWALQERSDVPFDDILEKVVLQGGVVPNLWALEVANVLGSLLRNGEMEEKDVKGVLADLAELPLAVDARTHEMAWKRTWRLAERHGLTAYDAAYLELAIREGGTLLTFDSGLLWASDAEGVLAYPL